jgi:predicted RNase H-like nuclease (RuvC/YqgF family)
MENFDVNKEFIQHLQKENEELKQKVRELEDKLEMERMMKNVDKIRPSIPIEPYYNDKPWWEKGPTCEVK